MSPLLAVASDVICSGLLQAISPNALYAPLKKLETWTIWQILTYTKISRLVEEVEFIWKIETSLLKNLCLHLYVNYSKIHFFFSVCDVLAEMEGSTVVVVWFLIFFLTRWKKPNVSWNSRNQFKEYGPDLLYIVKCHVATFLWIGAV